MVVIPPSDSFLRAFREHMRAAKVIPQGESLLLAVSGGLSSTALAYLCTALRDEWRTNIVLGHIQETPEAERSVQELAASLRLPLHVVAAGAVPEGAAEETANLSPLLAIPRVSGSARVATGETKDHEEEIEIARFLSGDVLGDAVGLAPAAGRFVRPLLPFRRDECRAFLERTDVPYYQSPARLLPTRTADRVRLLLMPLIRHHIEPSLAERLAARKRFILDDVALLQGLADAARREAAWSARGQEVTVNLPKFRRLPPSLRRRMLADAVHHVSPETRVLPADLLRLEEEILGAGRGPLRRALPPLSIACSGDTLSIRRV